MYVVQFDNIWEGPNRGQKKTLYDPEKIERGYVIYSPRLSLELNKPGSFSFTMRESHPYYSDLKKLRSTIYVYYNNEILFEGRIIDVSSDFYNNKTIECEGCLAYLIDTYTGPNSAEAHRRMSVPRRFKELLDSHNRKMDHVYTLSDGTTYSPTDRKIFANYSDSGFMDNYDHAFVEVDYNDTLSTVSNEILVSPENEQFPWESFFVVKYGYTDPSTGINYPEAPVLHLYKKQDKQEDIQESLKSNQVIKFGENMLDLSDKIDVSDIYTCAVPVGKDNLVLNANDWTKCFVKNDEAIKEYGIIFKALNFPDVTDVSTLRTRGEAELKNHGIKLKSTININAIDLSLINAGVDTIKVGYYYQIVSEIHGYTTGAYYQCTKAVYDLANSSNNSYVLGEEDKTITSSQANSLKQLKKMEYAVYNP